jgi:nucleoid-associated protein YgaU
MGIFDFIKHAGEKLLGRDHEEQHAADPAAANLAASQAILNYIAAQGLTADGLSVAFNGSDSSVTVTGHAANQEIKEKILVSAGNVKGVALVNDQITVAEGEEVEPILHTVVSGESLSAIAKQHYDNANEYHKIFEANQPMLSHPDKIYIGQNLRIPT